MIREALGLIFDPGQIVEVRALNGPTLTGYFDDLDRLAIEAAKIDRASRHEGVYVTANPVHPDLLARAVNMVQIAKRGESTTDRDILRRRWFLVDCDAKRPKGISSTDEQHEAALARACAIRDWLGARSWPAPLEADSGNGAHLMYRTEEPNDAPTLVLFQRSLQALCNRFGDEVVDIDLKPHNAARIWKLYGTVARKGDPKAAGRPHRRAKVLQAPSIFKLVARAQLEALAGEVPTAERKAPAAQAATQAASGWPGVESWCRDHGVSIYAEKDWPERDGSGTGRLWETECPWDPEHGRAAWVGEHASRRPDAGCQHNSCSGKRWPEFRDAHEAPGARQERERKEREYQERKREREERRSPPRTDADAPPGVGEAPEVKAPAPAKERSPCRFESSATRIVGEAQERAKLVERALQFNVPALDAALGGILPHDLIVLGAASGVGKTTMVSLIAESNARQGRRVHLFALEAEKLEVERRIKYRRLVDAYFCAGRSVGRERLSYRNWYWGKLGRELGDFEGRVEHEMEQDYRTLHTYYRDTQFTGEKLARACMEIHAETDLVIVDHLHYIDLETGESENAGVMAIVKRVRDVVLCIGKPVILVAHLHKRGWQEKQATLMPDIDAFYGTGAITKIATAAVLVARSKDPPAPSTPWIWETLIRLPKDRMEGSNASYVIQTGFNARRGCYGAEFLVGREVGAKFEPIRETGSLPYWALPEMLPAPAPPTRDNRMPGEDDE